MDRDYVERVVLSAILNNKISPPEKLGNLSFENENYDSIYKAYLAALKLNNKPQITHVIFKFKQINKKEIDYDYLDKIYKTSAHIDDAELFDYIDILYYESRRKTVLNTFANLINFSSRSDLSAQELIDIAVESLIALKSDHSDGALVSIGEVAEHLVHSWRNGKKCGGRDYLLTGYPEIDHYIEGLLPGRLFIIAGRPSSGKSSLLLNMAINAVWQPIVKEQNGKVLFVSLEMSTEELASRAIAYLLRTPIRKLTQQENNDAVNRIVDNLKNSGLYIYKQPSHDIGKLITSVFQFSAQNNLKAIFLDYIQLLNSEKKHANRNEELGIVSRSLKNMATEHNIPVIVGCQLSRAVEYRSDKQPTMSDLRESGNIEQDADVIITIHRQKLYDVKTDMPDVANIRVIKNRNGPIGELQLAFMEEMSSFYSINHEN